MSSPLASGKKGIVQKSFVQIHQTVSHSTRVELLARLLAQMIGRQFDGRSSIRCLDVGCGDMTLAERIQELNPAVTWTCLDIYQLPEDLPDQKRWLKYRQFDGIRLPFENKSYDVALFCDVLHHSGKQAVPLLQEARRVSQLVLVKDHFETSLYSRAMLWLMDFIGNWGYGVTLPRSYFTRNSFLSLCGECGLEESAIVRDVRLYDHLPILRWLLRPAWQFAAVLRDRGLERQ